MGGVQTEESKLCDGVLHDCWFVSGLIGVAKIWFRSGTGPGVFEWEISLSLDAVRFWNRKAYKVGENIWYHWRSIVICFTLKVSFWSKAISKSPRLAICTQWTQWIALCTIECCKRKLQMQFLAKLNYGHLSLDYNQVLEYEELVCSQKETFGSWLITNDALKKNRPLVVPTKIDKRGTSNVM